MSPEMIVKNWPGKITISDPVGLLTEIARRYETLERVIMEYIDNSLGWGTDLLISPM